MPYFIATNFAKSTLAGSIVAGDTAFSVQVGDGVLFPNPSGGQVFACVLADASTPNAPPFEIVWVGGRSGDAFSTVLRGREGTTAQNWPSGAVVSHRDTAAQLWQGAGASKQRDVLGSDVTTITNQASFPFAYTFLCLQSFTFPDNSPTDRFLLHVGAGVSAGAAGSGGTSGMINYGQIRIRVQDTTNVSSPIDLIPVIGWVHVADQVVGAGFDHYTSAIAGNRSAGPNWNPDDVAPTTGAGGPNTTTLLYVPGTTIEVTLLACLANTGALPIPHLTDCVGRLILTAIPG